MATRVIPSIPFERDVKPLLKKYDSLGHDLLVLQNELMQTPTLGTSLGGGLFKIRLGTKSKGGGKSGGFRVITDLVH